VQGRDACGFDSDEPRRVDAQIRLRAGDDAYAAEVATGDNPGIPADVAPGFESCNRYPLALGADDIEATLVCTGTCVRHGPRGAMRLRVEAPSACASNGAIIAVNTDANETMNLRIGHPPMRGANRSLSLGQRALRTDAELEMAQNHARSSSTLWFSAPSTAELTRDVPRDDRRRQSNATCLVWITLVVERHLVHLRSKALI
jgi:hypothetical protein